MEAAASGNPEKDRELISLGEALVEKGWLVSELGELRTDPGAEDLSHLSQWLLFEADPF